MNALEKWMTIQFTQYMYTKTPSYTEMDVLQKTCVQIILPAKWFVCHSSKLLSSMHSIKESYSWEEGRGSNRRRGG